MTLEELMKAAGQNGDHFAEDPNVLFGVRPVTSAGKYVLDCLGSAYEHYEGTTDEAFREAAASDLSEIALAVDDIAQTILGNDP